MTGTVRVHDLAHARAGDKGDTSNIGVVAYDARAYGHLRRHLTPDRVAAAFAALARGPVRRYELPKLRALNFVNERALGGGVTSSLRLDIHGKSLSSLMLAVEVPALDEGPP